MSSSIVVGNGLLAKAFINTNVQDVLFFCSGVSNSNEKCKTEFDREKNLLLNELKKNQSKCFIYFSSVLVSSAETPYLRHKKEMERLVQKSANSYILFRLPQVVGTVLNNTLVSTFIKKIYFNENIIIYKNAKRNLIDIDDLVRVSLKIIKKKEKTKLKEVINICSAHDISPYDLVNLISILMNKNIQINIINKDSLQECNICTLKEYLSADDILLNKDYSKKIIIKYLDSIIQLIERNIKNETK